jgi:hypothetical protein
LRVGLAREAHVAKGPPYRRTDAIGRRKKIMGGNVPPMIHAQQIREMIAEDKATSA